MNVLVTGASGFVGRHTTRHLKKCGFNVIGLDFVYPDDRSTFWTSANMPTKEETVAWLESYGLDGFIKYRLGTYENAETMQAVLEKVQGVQIILHLAAQSHVDRSIKGPRTFIDDNVGGTVELFEMARHMPKLEKVILFGTDEVVACLDEGSADEKAIMYCGSVYSASKGAQELLAQAYIKTHGLPIITTRSVNIFGPEQADEKFIPTVIRNAMSGKGAPIYGNGFQSRQWVSVEHVCDFLNWIAVNTFVPHGTILHITGTPEIPNIFLAHTILSLMGKPNMIEHVEDRLGHDVRYSLARGEGSLIWDSPVYAHSECFMQDLKATVDWYQQHYGPDYGGTK